MKLGVSITSVLPLLTVVGCATSLYALQGIPRSLDSEAHVFPERDPNVLSRSVTRLAQRLRLKNLRFHDLRHDAASTLTMAGVPQRTVMAVLGHRDPRMTMRYQHLTPEHLKDAMRALDAAPSGTITAPTESRSTGTAGNSTF